MQMNVVKTCRSVANTGDAVRGWMISSAIAGALFVAPSFAAAAPVTYAFDSGTVALSALLDGSLTSVLEGPSPINILLGGTSVTFDADIGPNGTITGLQLVPSTTLNLDLDESLVGLDTISVTNAQINHQVGGTSLVLPTNEFYIATVVTGDVAGFLPGGIPFGPTSVTSLDSASYGDISVSGNTITLNLYGINIARFAQLPGPGPDVLVKANFTFVGVIPEPGTALLIGLGLGGLSSMGRRRSADR
jgi:hypothetical protein